MIDRKTYQVEAATSSMVAALAPFIGRATVADAILLRALLDAADQGDIYLGPVDHLRRNAVETIKYLLDDFIICAEASGPACVRARSQQFARRNDWIGRVPDKAFLLIQSMAGDAFDAAHGTWDGELFDGTQANPDSVFEPRPWWEFRQAMLDSRE